MIIQESSLFLELTPAQLKKIINSSLNENIISYRLMEGGMFNTTYLIQTDKTGDVILSLGPINRHLIMPFEHKCMETEVMIFELMHKNGIPASEVLAFDNSKTIVDRDYSIIKYIKSCMVIDAEKFYPGKMPYIMEQFGIALKKFHSVKAVKFGRVPDVLAGKGFDKNSEFLKSEVKDWISVAKNTEFFTQSFFDNVTEVFNRFSDILDEITQAHLVHGDVARTNALVHTQKAKPELAAIIDPERGFFGDPQFDIAMIDYFIDDDFIKGYGDIYDCDEHTKIRRMLYKLLRRMFDSYVWGAEYNQPDNMQETRSFIYETTEKLLKGEF